MLTPSTSAVKVYGVNIVPAVKEEPLLTALHGDTRPPYDMVE
jgi:hypothetical protein